MSQPVVIVVYILLGAIMVPYHVHLGRRGSQGSPACVTYPTLYYIHASYAIRQYAIILIMIKRIEFIHNIGVDEL